MNDKENVKNSEQETTQPTLQVKSSREDTRVRRT
jgi:hypothetical protein